MYRAIYDNNPVKIQQMLAAGFDVNSGWFPPLAWAAYLGRADLVELLLKYNAGLDYAVPGVYSHASYPAGRPLHLAAYYDRFEIARLLPARRAKVNIQCKSFNACDYGYNKRLAPLDLVRSFNIWKLLYEAGAQPAAAWPGVKHTG
jgi:ankyrin repeat protein